MRTRLAQAPAERSRSGQTADRPRLHPSPRSPPDGAGWAAVEQEWAAVHRQQKQQQWQRQQQRQRQRQRGPGAAEGEEGHEQRERERTAPALVGMLPSLHRCSMLAAAAAAARVATEWAVERTSERTDWMTQAGSSNGGGSSSVSFRSVPL